MAVKINILKPDHHYILEAINHLDGANQALDSVFSLLGDEMDKRSQAYKLVTEAGDLLRTLELQLEKRISAK
jgi:hypothetical protein